MASSSLSTTSSGRGGYAYTPRLHSTVATPQPCRCRTVETRVLPPRASGLSWTLAWRPRKQQCTCTPSLCCSTPPLTCESLSHDHASFVPHEPRPTTHSRFSCGGARAADLLLASS
eukprot:37897-Chlamydomonas_euryale.AAC.18